MTSSEGGDERNEVRWLSERVMLSKDLVFENCRSRTKQDKKKDSKSREKKRAHRLDCRGRSSLLAFPSRLEET